MTIETDPKSYKDIYSFATANVGADGQPLFSGTIEEFENVMKDKTKAFSFHAKMVESDLLKDNNVKFSDFTTNYNLPYQVDQTVESPMLTKVDLKEGSKAVQSSSIETPDEVEKNFINRENKINITYANELKSIEKQLKNKEIDKYKYDSLINNLEKNKSKSVQNNIEIKNEDLNRPTSNPLVNYMDYDKNGKLEKKTVGIHDWAYRQKDDGELDLSKSNYYFKLNTSRQKEDFVPFLKNQYPGYKFEYKDRLPGVGINKEGNAQSSQQNGIQVTNEETGKTTFVSLQGNDIYKQKNELTSFINDNGVNVTQTVLNLSDQAQEVTKIVNTPYNEESPKSGGIALNESDEIQLSKFGAFNSKPTEIGVFPEFIPNPNLFVGEKVKYAQKLFEQGKISEKAAKDPYGDGFDEIQKYIRINESFDIINRTATGPRANYLNSIYNAKKPGDAVGYAPGSVSYSGAGSKIYNDTAMSLSSARLENGQAKPTKEEIENQVARKLYEIDKGKATDSHWDAYLKDNPKFIASKIRGSQIVESDANLRKSVELQELNKIELFNIENPNNEDNLLIDYFQDIYNDVSKDFPTSNGEMIRFKNGKTVSKSLFNQYENAINGRNTRVGVIANRRNESWRLQDETNDINSSWDLLKRDYDTWRQSGSLFLNTFADIGVGITYLGSKVAKVAGVAMTSYLEFGSDGEFNFDEMWKSYDDAFADWGQEWTDKKEEITNSYQKEVGFHQDNWGGASAFSGNFGGFMAQEVARQIPILATMMATGGTAGPLLIGAYSAGDHWMQDDMRERKTGVYENEWMQAASAIGYGASEAIFERLTTIPILKRGQKLIGEMGERSIFSYKEGMKRYFKQELKNVPQEGITEAVGEGLTQITQNMIDGKPYLEGVDHAMFTGGVFGFSMSAAPFIAGAAAQGFTDYDSMKEFRGISTSLNSQRRSRQALIEKGIDVTAQDNIIQDLESQQRVLLDKKFNQISTTLSNQAMNSLMNNTSEQELIRVEVKKIIDDTSLSKEVKQEQLKLQKNRFDNLQYDSGTWKNAGAFGNDFKFLKDQDVDRYNKIIEQAKLDLKANRNKTDDLQQSAIQAQAYDIYVAQEIDNNFEVQSALNKSKGLNISLQMFNTNKEAAAGIDNILEERIKKLKDSGADEVEISKIKDQFKELKENLNNGNNGVEIPGLNNDANLSLVFKENAIKNDKRQVGLHEVGHTIFTELISRDSKDFIPLANTIVDYLSRSEKGKDVLTRIRKRDSQVDTMADELVMNFLEEVGNKNVPLTPELAVLVGQGMNEGMMSATDGEFKFDFKGSTDALASLISLGESIASGNLTKEQVSQIKESGVFTPEQKIVEVLENELKSSGTINETAEEKTSRRNEREVSIKKDYELYAENKDNEAWRSFLDTEQGGVVLRNLIVPFIKEIEAIAKGDMDLVAGTSIPLIAHIKAFNPLENNDLAGYIGSYLDRKVGTARKTLAKGEAPKDVRTKRLDVQKEGERKLDIAADEVVEIKEELNMRQLMGIEEGGNAYNKVLKVAQSVVGGKLPSLKYTRKKKGQADQVVSLQDVKKVLADPKSTAKDINQANIDVARIYKEVRQNLANDYSDALVDTILDDMGTGKSFNDYLIKNKKAILKGFPISDLVAMERLSNQKIFAKVDKKNLSPTEIARYEGTGRLITTSKTSGPTLYSRQTPSDAMFLEFFNKRGRKLALAKNISSQLGFDASMQEMSKQDTIDKITLGNPDMKWMAAEQMLNTYAQAIDRGTNFKFSGNIKEALGSDKAYNTFAKNQGLLFTNIISVGANTGWSNEIKDLKKQIRFAVESTYEESLSKTEITSLTNYLSKVMIPYSKQVNTYKDVDLDVVDYIKEVEMADEDKSLSKFAGLNRTITSLFIDEAGENTVKQKEFNPLLVNGMLKSGYYKGKKNQLIADIITYQGMFNSGVDPLKMVNGKYVNQGRYMTYANKDSFVSEFLTKAFGITKYDRGSVKLFNELGFKLKKNEKPSDFLVIEIDGKSEIIKSPPMTAQVVTESMIGDNMSKEEKAKRKADSDRAWNYITNMYRTLGEMKTAGVATNENIAMIMAGAGANMKGPIRAAAMFRYAALNPPTTDLRVNGEKQFEYEHGIPATVINVLLADALINGNTDIDLKELKDSYSVGAIHVAMNDNFSMFFKSRMPFDYKIGDLPLKRWYNNYTTGGDVHAVLDVIDNVEYGKAEADLWTSIQEAAKVNEVTMSNSVTSEGMKQSSNGEVISYANTIDAALAVARDPNAPIKKIRIFDFDDTLATTKSDILFTSPDGTKGKLNAEEFASNGKSMLDLGFEFDFSEFNKVTDGKRGPLFNLAKTIRDARGNEDLFVLTARAPEAQTAIYEYLKSQGLEFKIDNIIGLGNSTGGAKAAWVIEKAAEGYNDFYFADDATQNVKAVQDALDQLDVKSRVQQAKIEFKNSASENFNKILEDTSGIEFYKTYSDSKARLVGDKNQRKRLLPYSAEDFEGLIYPLLGKGKQGEGHKKFFEKNLFEPFARAMENMSIARINVMDDFRKLKKDLNMPSELKKKNDTSFSNENAVRVYIWTALGEEVPGLSKRDLTELNNIVANNMELKSFAEQVLMINKGKYVSPKSDWLGGNVSSDLLGSINSLNREEYLKEWIENKNLIFSKENLNKLEAIHGPKYREALENSLARMQAGSNRITGQNRIAGKFLDYLNNSQGVVMFLNMKSALLQTISSANFVNWSFNNPAKAGLAFANQPQYWADFMELMNSDFLKDRRNGLRINISEAEVSEAAAKSKNKAKAAVSWLIQKGYAPTQFADSFAIASGGATYFRNRINDLMKRDSKMTEVEAKKIAMREFREISEKSQQSSRPDKISQQQASDVGRLLLNWANTQQQYVRIQARAVQDLVNRRGDAKEHISKIAYYGIVQNLLFNAAQQALFALGFNDEDDEEVINQKYVDVANGAADGVLRGMGIGGHLVSVSKNIALDIYKRSGRDRPEYTDAAWKMIQVTPVVSSKVSRLKQALWQFDSKKRRQEMIDKGFSLDNPAYDAVAKVVAATTNIPLDRAMTKFDNIEAMLSDETALWEDIALFAGYSTWMLESSADKKANSSSSKEKNPFAKKSKSKSNPFAITKKKKSNPFAVK